MREVSDSKRHKQQRLTADHRDNVVQQSQREKSATPSSTTQEKAKHRRSSSATVVLLAPWRLRARYYFFPTEDRKLLMQEDMASYARQPSWRFDWFGKLSVLVVLLNLVTLALYDPTGTQRSQSLRDTIAKLQYFFVAFFVFETLMRIVCLGARPVFTKAWNVLDVVIAFVSVVALMIASTVPDLASFGGIRAVQVLRPVKAIGRIPEIKLVINSVVRSLRYLSDVAALYLLFVVAMSCAGIALFAGQLERRCVRNEYFLFDMINASEVEWVVANAMVQARECIASWPPAAENSTTTSSVNVSYAAFGGWIEHNALAATALTLMQQQQILLPYLFNASLPSFLPTRANWKAASFIDPRLVLSLLISGGDSGGANKPNNKASFVCGAYVDMALQRIEEAAALLLINHADTSAPPRDTGDAAPATICMNNNNSHYDNMSFSGSASIAMYEGMVLNLTSSLLARIVASQTTGGAVYGNWTGGTSCDASTSCDDGTVDVFFGLSCPYGYTCSAVSNPSFGLAGFNNFGEALLTVLSEPFPSMLYAMNGGTNKLTGVVFGGVLIVIATLFIMNLAVALISIEFEKERVEAKELLHTQRRLKALAKVEEHKRNVQRLITIETGDGNVEEVLMFAQSPLSGASRWAAAAAADAASRPAASMSKKYQHIILKDGNVEEVLMFAQSPLSGASRWSAATAADAASRPTASMSKRYQHIILKAAAKATASRRTAASSGSSLDQHHEHESHHRLHLYQTLSSMSILDNPHVRKGGFRHTLLRLWSAFTRYRRGRSQRHKAVMLYLQDQKIHEDEAAYLMKRQQQDVNNSNLEMQKEDTTSHALCPSNTSAVDPSVILPVILVSPPADAQDEKQGAMEEMSPLCQSSKSHSSKDDGGDTPSASNTTAHHHNQNNAPPSSSLLALLIGDDKEEDSSGGVQQQRRRGLSTFSSTSSTSDLLERSLRGLTTPDDNNNSVSQTMTTPAATPPQGIPQPADITKAERLRFIFSLAVRTRLFSIVSTFSMCVMLVAMSVEYYGMPSRVENAMSGLNVLFTVFITAEMTVRFLASDPVAFLTNIEQLSGVLIVIASWADLASTEVTFTAIRALRLVIAVRLLRIYFPALYGQLVVMVRAFRSSLVLITVMALEIFIFACLGMQFLGGKHCSINPGSRFLDVAEAGQLATTADWLPWDNFFLPTKLQIPVTAGGLATFQDYAQLPNATNNGVPPPWWNAGAFLPPMVNDSSIFDIDSSNYTVIPSLTVENLLLDSVLCTPTGRLNFDSFGYAMLTTFTILTSDQWNDILFQSLTLYQNPAMHALISVLFVTQYYVGSYILLNLFIGILIGTTEKLFRNGGGGGGGGGGGELTDRVTSSSALAIDEDGADATKKGNQQREAAADVLSLVSKSSSDDSDHDSDDPFSGSDFESEFEPAAAADDDDTSSTEATVDDLRHEAALPSPTESLEYRPPDMNVEDQQPTQASLHNHHQHSIMYDVGDVVAPPALKEKEVVLFYELQREERRQSNSTVEAVAPAKPSTFTLSILVDASSGVVATHSRRGSRRERSMSTTSKRLRALASTTSSSRPHPSSRLLSPSATEKSTAAILLGTGESKDAHILLRVVNHPIAKSFMILVVIVSCLSLSRQQVTLAPDEPLMQWLTIVDLVCSGIFIVEFCLRIIGEGGVVRSFYGAIRVWNWVELTLIACNIADLILTIAFEDAFNIPHFLRALYILRPLRILRKSPGIRVVIRSIGGALHPLRNVVAIALMIYLVAAIMGVQLFMGSMRTCYNSPRPILTESECIDAGYAWENTGYNFDHVGQALISLFVVSSLQKWGEVLFAVVDAVGPGVAPQQDANPAAAFYVLTFAVIGGFFFISLFVSVLIRSYEHQYKAEARRSAFLTKEQTQWLNGHASAIASMPLAVFLAVPFKERYRLSFWGRCRATTIQLSLQPALTTFVNAVVVASMIGGAAQHYPRSDAFDTALNALNAFVTAVYLAEAMIKLIAVHPELYFSSSWNRFDFFVLLMSLGDVAVTYVFTSFSFYGGAVRALRTARAGRLLRFAVWHKRLPNLILRFIHSLFSLFSLLNVAAFLALTIVLYALLTIRVFGALAKDGVVMNSYRNYDTFVDALMALMQVLFDGDWSILTAAAQVEHDSKLNSGGGVDESSCMLRIGSCGNAPVAYILFITYFIVGRYVLLNIFIAVIVESFRSDAQSRQNAVTEKEMQAFVETWVTFDRDRRLYLATRDLLPMLQCLPSGHPFAPPPDRPPAYDAPPRQRRRYLVQHG
ncbi:calcium channel protein, putative, partial [Bodo saltans]